ncbi:MAG: response regulator, partial [Kiritimatiellaceae bacterium]|nr:response regulator [Kiritimatiellaceae bacterium]
NIKIETNKTVFDEASQSVNQNISTGTYVEMTFSDNGKGLDAKACERIFEPYFGNTNAREGSSGLGLATVHGIVHQNGGFITVQSNVSQGSIFKVYIPFYVEKKRVRQKAPPSYNNPRGTETILFVEDDENLLTLGKMQLQELGYTVLSTLLADSAIGISKDFPGVIDLLLTDVIMPEMNGVELSKRIKQQRPDIKRLFMSGYTADIMDDSGEINLALNFLQKPFSSHDLAEKLRAILDKNPKDPDQDEH